METISRCQLIQLDDERVALRCYDEEKDAFKRVCVAQKVSILEDDKLFLADERLYYDYRGKLRFVGMIGDVKPLLVGSDKRVLMSVLAVENKIFPFRYVFFRGELEHQMEVETDLIRSYVLEDGKVEAMTLDGKVYTYYVDCETDEWGRWEYDFVAIR